MVFDSVRDRPLGDIWREGADFQRYRGTDWMSPTCAGCERRDVDFGGCRCQAFALTGDAARTDPSCPKSPDHHLVRDLRRERPAATTEPDGPLYRIDIRRGPRAS